MYYSRHQRVCCAKHEVWASWAKSERRRNSDCGSEYFLFDDFSTENNKKTRQVSVVNVFADNFLWRALATCQKQRHWRLSAGMAGGTSQEPEKPCNRFSVEASVPQGFKIKVRTEENSMNDEFCFSAKIQWKKFWPKPKVSVIHWNLVGYMVSGILWDTFRCQY